MDKIARLCQEIEQLRREVDDHNYYLDNSEQALGYGLALNDIEKFLDALQAEERPEPYIPVYDEEYLTEKQRLFKEHHGEVDVDKMLAECRGYDEEKEEPDKSLEEAAEEWAENEAYGKSDAEFEMAYKGFIAGAEGQKERDLAEMAQSRSPLSVAYANRCFENGKQAMREQMLKDAVEGEAEELYNDGESQCVVSVGTYFEPGDKVYVLKAEEE